MSEIMETELYCGCIMETSITKWNLCTSTRGQSLHKNILWNSTNITIL